MSNYGRPSRLSPFDVARIRADPRKGKLIAADYGITSAYVSLLKAGKRMSAAAEPDQVGEARQ